MMGPVRHTGFGGLLRNNRSSEGGSNSNRLWHWMALACPGSAQVLSSFGTLFGAFAVQMLGVV